MFFYLQLATVPFDVCVFAIGLTACQTKHGRLTFVKDFTVTFNGMCKYCSVINSAVNTYHFLITLVM